MSRARRARRIATSAAYNGGIGMAGVGALGALGYGLLRVEALIARRIVGTQFDAPPPDRGMYGAGFGPPYQLVMLGDSSAAGLGADQPWQTVGAAVSNGVSALSGRSVRLTNVAVVGAKSADLGVQVANALEEVPHPDVCVIMIGANDVTHRIDKSVAVRHLELAVRALRAAGAEVVVATCPDLGTIEPIPQPLRALGRYWSRDLAAAQTVVTVEAGGRTVSLGDLLGPEFLAAPREMFSKDRFHPSSAGYARAAAAILPTACVALGLWAGEEDRQPDRRRGEGIGPIAVAAQQAVRDPGTEVSATDVAGHRRGARAGWAVLLRRPRNPVTDRSELLDPAGAGSDSGTDRADGGADTAGTEAAHGAVAQDRDRALLDGAGDGTAAPVGRSSA